MQIIERNALDILGPLARRDPGVVHQTVEPAEVLLDPRQRHRPVRLGRHVEAQIGPTKLGGATGGIDLPNIPGLF